MQKKAVVAVINYKDKVLIGKKKNYSNHFLSEKWHVPGETLEDGENEEDALIRGMLEEAGIKITPGKYIEEHLTPTHKIAKWYECFANDEKTKPGSDLQETKWVTKKEVPNICHERAVNLWPSEVLDYFNN
jgi:ADP-ribose pyrophosphatase YjhB (NUDIX family)